MMPEKIHSEKQRKFFLAAAHNPNIAKRAGITQEEARHVLEKEEGRYKIKKKRK